MRGPVKATLLAVLLVVALLSSACGGERIQYVANSASYDAQELQSLLERVSPGGLADLRSEDADPLRSKALAELRRKGEGGNEVADLITATFPGVARAVPYYVESARFDGLDATIVIEATGREGGVLAERRLWAIDATGRVLISLMR